MAVALKLLIQRKDHIAIANCVYNDWQLARGGSCNQPKEVCFMFDFYADYYVNTGMGRWISKDEALAILEKAGEAGLVAQRGISEDSDAFCNCCPDCCGILRQLKRLPQPAQAAVTNHFAKIDTDLCNNCETCIDRCPMDAIALSPEEIAQINLDRCIGCGLCVSTCPEKALSLEKKPEKQRFEPVARNPAMRPSKEFEDQIMY